MKANHVTLIMGVRNHAEFVPGCVETLFSQTHEDFTLVLVDDGSTDNLAEVAAGITDPRLVFVRLARNIGAHAVKNFVLRNFADGEFIAHQDADDFSDPTRLEKQIARMRAHDLAACGTGVDEFFEDPDTSPRFSKEIEAVFDASDGFYHKINPYPERLHWEDLCDPSVAPHYLKIAVNGALMYRTEVLKELGGHQGRTPVGADTDLLIRISPFHGVGNVPEILYARRFHENSVIGGKDTHFESPVRMRFIEEIEARRAEIRAHMLGGDRERARAAATLDAYYPDVEYEVP